jgi:amino acid permease
MGTGFLTLPWAFYESGYILGTFVMFALLIPGSISVLFILETMSRAAAMDDHKDQKSYDNNRKCEVRNRKYEIPDLCEKFISKRAKQIYTLTISLYLYGALWAYATVFSNSMAANISLGSYSYYIYLFLFSIVVVPISCMELNEQIKVQVALAYCRGIMIVFMVGTVLYEMSRKDHSVNAFLQGNVGSGSDHTVEWDGLRIILSTACYAYIFHHSIPALSQPVKDKQQLALIFNTALLFCFVSYTLIGVLLAVYFGPDIQSSSNLNWDTYGYFQSNIGIFIGKCIKFYVLIFPALDVSSVFPLCAITLGNNLMSTLEGSTTRTHTRSQKTFYRLSAVFPPLIGASLISKLGNITNFSGITGFVVCFIFPPLLAYYSREALVHRHINYDTIYSNMFTSIPVMFMILMFGIVMVFYTLFCLINYGPPE